jgi:hypothetical protein
VDLLRDDNQYTLDRFLEPTPKGWRHGRRRSRGVVPWRRSA